MLGYQTLTKMKKILLLVCMITLTTVGIIAGPVNQHRAGQLGQSFLSAAKGTQKLDIQLVYYSADRSDIDYYVFNASDGNGFVVIAGDDRVRPVLAYSTTGSFDPNDVADGFEYTLNSFGIEIQYAREHDIEATADIEAEWKSVAETGNIKQGRTTRAVVGPLCQTIWNQNYPWNSQCPEDEEGSGGYVYAGCVATAMGQVMKYYDWPPRGTGSYTYYPDGYAPQTANFGETDYHFELMPLELDSTSTEADYFYIAQFLHHCGIAVDMQYGVNGSGAYSQDVPAALENYFGYTTQEYETFGYWGWYFYTNEQWIQMLKDGGLDEHIPLYYSGSDDDGAGGHAFVCDGYDENDYFHFNWGWSGRDDAWCPIGALHTTKYNFNDWNSFIGHIIPDSPAYNNRPEAVTDFNIVENNDMQSVTITWTNPENTLNGELLEDFSITVSRNNDVIFNTSGKKGTAMEFIDENLAAGLYKYSVIAENEAGFSKRSYFEILVGDKCDITFVLHDESGDGWKGASISVTSEYGQRIAVITMKEGSDETITLPLLKGDINFIWNHGWYHSIEEYDTDFECSFSIENSNGMTICTSPEELTGGVFLTYNNDCEHTSVAEIIENNAKVYPNPTNGIVNVECEGVMTISVLNILSQEIMTTTADDIATIDLSNCESGIYILKIDTGDGMTIQKVRVGK